MGSSSPPPATLPIRRASDAGRSPIAPSCAPPAASLDPIVEDLVAGLPAMLGVDDVGTRAALRPTPKGTEQPWGRPLRKATRARTRAL
jgi:hypothetical protein